MKATEMFRSFYLYFDTVSYPNIHIYFVYNTIVLKQASQCDLDLELKTFWNSRIHFERITCKANFMV